MPSRPTTKPRKPQPVQKRARAQDPFPAGAMVIITLANPRDKFWGAIVALKPEGISLVGIELASFDDLVAMVRDQEPFSPSVVFFPMHRVERMELDISDSSIPSLSQRFATKTGQQPAALLMRYLAVPAPEGAR